MVNTEREVRVGIDVSKRTLEVCVLASDSPRGEPIMRASHGKRARKPSLTAALLPGPPEASRGRSDRCAGGRPRRRSASPSPRF